MKDLTKFGSYGFLSLLLAQQITMISAAETAKKKTPSPVSIRVKK
jgi:hypothetical protein